MMYDMDLESPLDELAVPVNFERGEPVDSASAALVDLIHGRDPTTPVDRLDDSSALGGLRDCAAGVVGNIVAGASPNAWLDRLESFYDDSYQATFSQETMPMLGAASAWCRGDEQNARARLASISQASMTGFPGLLDLWSRDDIDWQNDDERIHLLFVAVRTAKGMRDDGVAVLLMAAGRLGGEELRRRLKGGAHTLEEGWPRPALNTGEWTDWDVSDRKILYPVDVFGEGQLATWDPFFDRIVYRLPTFIGRPVVGRTVGTPAFEKLTKRRLKRMYADPNVTLEFQHRLGEDVDLTAGFAAADRLFRTAVTYGVPLFEQREDAQGTRLRGPIRWVVTQHDEIVHELEVQAPEPDTEEGQA